MSIKIFDGYRIKENLSFDEAIKLCNIFGKKAIERYNSELSTRLIRLECFVVDAYLHGDPQLLDFMKHRLQGNYSPCTAIYMYALGLASDKKNDPLKNNIVQELQSCALNLFSTDNNILMIFYGWNGYLPLLQEIKNIEEYQYFDNADQPENLSQEEWYQRYDNWEKAGAFAAPFSHNCFKYMPFGNGDYFPIPNAHSACLPSRADRASRLGKAIWRKKLNEIYVEENIMQGSKIIELAEKHQQDINTTIKELETQLIDLSYEKLNMTIAELIKMHSSP